MALRDEWDKKCDDLIIDVVSAERLWNFISEKFGETQEKLLDDLQRERSVRQGLEKRVATLNEELRKALEE